MKKVCVVTAARSEYGPLRWIIDEIYNSKDLELQLVVTGSHLSSEHGNTIKFIEQDGYPITKKVEYLLSTSTSSGIGKSMGCCGFSFADVFSELSPDILIVLGDRYELLPICSTALVMNIPIAHISGGDITEGAIDNQVRNAITMMSNIHFPGNEESANNIIRMIGHNKHVYNVGEPGLDSFKKCTLMSRAELSKLLNINSNADWILVTLHPETCETIEYNVSMAHNMIKALLSHNDKEIVITQSNADLGGVQINDIFKKYAHDYEQIHFYSSLGQIKYLSFMNEASLVIGNSSSGILEAPSLGIPVVNIGNRQRGRHICNNIVNCMNNQTEISNAIMQSKAILKQPDYYYGDGCTSPKIIKAIQMFLNVVDNI